MPDDLVASAVGIASGITRPIGKSFCQAPADHPIYALVGRVASKWAQLEHDLDTIIWKLAGIADKLGVCITAQMMGVWPRFNAIQSLLIQRSNEMPILTELIKEVNTLSNDSRDASERRNRIIHDPWYIIIDLSEQAAQLDEQTDQPRSMPRSDRIYGLLDRDRDDILATLKDINKLSEGALVLKRKITSGLSASP
jgi:hypothetical protein